MARSVFTCGHTCDDDDPGAAADCRQLYPTITTACFSLGIATNSGNPDSR